MPLLSRVLLLRRTGPLGLALTAYRLWRRIPPEQRRRIVEQTRKQAPRVAGRVRRKRP